jgi:predicted TIM-barrel fold metal-dependent hydrolase
LVERQREGEVPFLGYHAAIALRNAARALAAQRELVRRAIAEAIAAVKARYPDRYQERNRYPVLAGALALVTGERRVTRG